MCFHYLQELYSWDRGNQLTYPVRYHEIGHNSTLALDSGQAHQAGPPEEDTVHWITPLQSQPLTGCRCSIIWVIEHGKTFYKKSTVKLFSKKEWLFNTVRYESFNILVHRAGSRVHVSQLELVRTTHTDSLLAYSTFQTFFIWLW